MDAAQREPFERAVSEMETRRSELLREMEEVDSRVRQLMLIDEVCPDCLGTGVVTVRGGLYGERQPRVCRCRLVPGSEAEGLPCPRHRPQL